MSSSSVLCVCGLMRLVLLLPAIPHACSYLCVLGCVIMEGESEQKAILFLTFLLIKHSVFLFTVNKEHDGSITVKINIKLY